MNWKKKFSENFKEDDSLNNPDSSLQNDLSLEEMAVIEMNEMDKFRNETNSYSGLKSYVVQEFVTLREYFMKELGVKNWKASSYVDGKVDHYVFSSDGYKRGIQIKLSGPDFIIINGIDNSRENEIFPVAILEVNYDGTIIEYLDQYGNVESEERLHPESLDYVFETALTGIA